MLFAALLMAPHWSSLRSALLLAPQRASLRPVLRRKACKRCD